MNEGHIVQVIGPVIDIEFSGGNVPPVLNAIKVPRKSVETGEDTFLICEVQQHLGEDRVRTISMDSTDGLVRGMLAQDLGEPITVPVGPEVLGRLINVIGDTIDGKPPIQSSKRSSIHRPSPLF